MYTECGAAPVCEALADTGSGAPLLPAIALRFAIAVAAVPAVVIIDGRGRSRVDAFNRMPPDPGAAAGATGGVGVGVNGTAASEEAEGALRLAARGVRGGSAAVAAGGTGGAAAWTAGCATCGVASDGSIVYLAVDLNERGR